MAEPQPLAGCVAFVACNDSNQRLALVSRLRTLGAQIAARLGREVSHVVFSRAAGPTPEQKTQEDADLRTLFDRARKVGRSGRLAHSSRCAGCAAAPLAVVVRWRPSWRPFPSAGPPNLKNASCRPTARRSLSRRCGSRALLSSAAAPWWVASGTWGAPRSGATREQRTLHCQRHVAVHAVINAVTCSHNNCMRTRTRPTGASLHAGQAPGAAEAGGSGEVPPDRR
jgi:hypothetical protein